jgi:hypothetical protein
MVLTEEEKKEYLINYQSTDYFSSVTVFVLLFIAGFCEAAVLITLNDLGYTHIDLNNMQKMLFFVILFFLVVQLIKYVLDKWHEK